MDAEQKWRLFQIKPGKPKHIYIDPEDPKGLKAIQARLKEQDDAKAQGLSPGQEESCGTMTN